MPYKNPLPKVCPFCGVDFMAYDPRLVYCSKECSDDNLRVTRRGEGNSNWSANPTRHAGSQRARYWYDLQPCEVCGSEKSERHHRDGDSRNNERSNIMFLCRRHHMIEDGRMQRLHQANQRWRDASRSEATQAG